METLTNSEVGWRDNYEWLLECGYQLRPRLRPGWIPSWISDPPKDPMDAFRREDFEGGPSIVIDATRVSDGQVVILKHISKTVEVSGTEKEIACYVSLSVLQDDPENHCVRVLEVLKKPDDDSFEVLVMPLLRPFNSPRFETVGEGVDFFRQAFEGLQFLHRHRNAHRDCTGPNIMMDCELFPGGWHPRRLDKNPEFTGPAKQVFTRTQKPPRYLWIDFGLSAHFKDPTNPPRYYAAHGTDKTAPEFRRPMANPSTYNPFPTDIYYLGNLVRMYFLDGSKYEPRISGFEFMRALVDDLVRENPEERPNINDCVSRLNEIVDSIPAWKLRCQVQYSTDNVFDYIVRFIPYVFRLFIFVLFDVPAIPSRKNE